MYKVILLQDFNPGKYRKQVDKTLKELANGQFVAAEVKKMPETGYYRARLDQETRLLFRFGRYQNETVLLVLELIVNHDYGHSRFLRGASVDESRLVPVTDTHKPANEEKVAFAYLNSRLPKFHLLDKFLSFDDTQDQVLKHPLPQIIIGSAGSGKTALVLEITKTLPGRVLYVTHSAYLAENSSQWFYANHYENEQQEIDFLSYREFLETIRIPVGKEIDFRIFSAWFAGYQQAARLKDAHKVFEEFRGVLTGLDTTSEHLSEEEYLALGIKQSIFLPVERKTVYGLFLKYLGMLKETDHYDKNIYSFKLLGDCTAVYDYVVIDEVQDFTNTQLSLILKSLKFKDHFVLCGDANQVVHPNFFSWSHLKSLFYHDRLQVDEICFLQANYRNSPAVSELANKLLKIKTARFGSLDKESNYLINCASQSSGEIILLDELNKSVTELAQKTRRSVNHAVLVLRDEDKLKAAKIFPTPLLFSVQESKGLEYQNIILFNFISDNPSEFNEICSGVTQEDLSGEELSFSRGKDKTDKSHETYKFYINALYVALTRAVNSVYIIEQSSRHRLVGLLGIREGLKNHVVDESISTQEEWKRESRRLEMMDKKEQADAIRKDLLVEAQPNWTPMTAEVYSTLKDQALDPSHFNKKAKDQLFEFALIHNQVLIIEKLADLNYRRAEKPEVERGSVIRKYYQTYRDDNLKLVMQGVNKYGIDYRDLFNFTPLHAAVFTGAANLTSALLELGADPSLPDTFYKLPVQVALLQAFVNKDYAKTKLGRIFPLLQKESISLQVRNQLIKIDSHKIEFVLVNLLIAVQSSIQQGKGYFDTIGVRVDDLTEPLQNFPPTVMPDYRKKRTYWLALLAKHEEMSNNPYGKMLTRRVERGVYVLNEKLQIKYKDEWMFVLQIIESQNIDKFEIQQHSLSKFKKQHEEAMRQYEKDKEKHVRLQAMKRNRNNW